MSISHSLESLSNEQKSNLELAQTLLDNLNSIKPSHISNTTLNFDGNKFSPIQVGFAHKFLVDDVHLSIKSDLDKHKNFILKTFRNEFKNYDLQSKSSTRTENLRILISSFTDYYKYHPLYFNNQDFKHFIDDVTKSAEKELPKS